MLLLAAAAVSIIALLAVLVFFLSRTGAAHPAPAIPSAASADGGSAVVPPIPAYPSPAHRLAPGIYMFGQLWRFDGRAWQAVLGDDCEPVVAIFDAGPLGTCAVTWDSAYRRATPRGPWVREYQSPHGRPRLASGWGHPSHGLFAVGDRGTLLRSQGDGAWHRVPVPQSLGTVLSAVWGDDTRLYVGTADGRIASSRWGSLGEWEIDTTPTSDFIFDGVCTARGVYAISQSGDVLFSPAGEARWIVDKKLAGAAKGLLADASGSVWVSSHDGILRSDRPGHWVREETETRDEVCALGSNGSVSWAGGGRSILMRRDATGRWIASPPGRSGTIQSLWVGPDGELLAGTDFMLEVGAAGDGKDVEVLASVSTT
jgi:hypothetical protein